MIKQEILELLRLTGQETVFSFIANYAEEDKHFYEKIKEALLPDDDEEFDMDFYRELAEDCFDFGFDFGYRRSYDYDFREAALRAASDLNEILKDANSYIKQRTFGCAVGRAMAVIELIALNTENVSDYDGELSETFDRAVTMVCDTVNNTSVADWIKKEIYDWSKVEAAKDVYSEYDIQSIYDLCCEKMGNTEEVIADLDRKINESTNEHHKCKAVLQKIRFMKARNMDIKHVAESYPDMNEVRKEWFTQLKEEGNYNEALRIAEQGIEIAKQRAWGAINDWHKSIFDIYCLQGDKTNMRQKAEFLVMQTGYDNKRDDYYKTLKECTPAAEWQDTVERLLTAAEKFRDFDNFIACIMKEHQLWQRLFNYCKNSGIDQIEKYESDLKPHYGKEILELYREQVEKQVLVTDWRAYGAVARLLKRMKSFAGGNELVTQLLEKYRTTYKRRTKMIEALKDV